MPTIKVIKLVPFLIYPYWNINSFIDFTLLKKLLVSNLSILEYKFSSKLADNSSFTVSNLSILEYKFQVYNHVQQFFYRF